MDVPAPVTPVLQCPTDANGRILGERPDTTMDTNSINNHPDMGTCRLGAHQRINDSNHNDIDSNHNDIDNIDNDPGRQPQWVNGEIDIAEVFSPPRIAAAASKQGLRGGWSLDLTTGWDLSDPEQQKQAMRLLRESKPRMVIACPPCTPFSTLMRWNWRNMKPDKVQEVMCKAIAHLSFAVAMCEEQHRAGRLFMFEHPARATSWNLDVLNDLRHLPGVISVLSDMCAHGLKSTDKLGTALVKKTTRFITNSQSVATAVGVRCSKTHRHVVLVDGKAKAAGIYPQGLCEAVCRGVKEHFNNTDNKPVGMRTSLECAHSRVTTTGPSPPQNTTGATETIEMDVYSTECHGAAVNHATKEVELFVDLAICEDDYEPTWTATDDVNGGRLDPKDVLKARILEMEYMRKRGVYKLATRAEALRVAGKVINTMWIDSNKGDDASRNYRSRFVAKEFRGPGHIPIFAGTPPLESLRALIRMCAAHQSGPVDQRWGMMCVDVSRAHFYAPAVRRVFVKLPPEDPASHDPEAVGELQMSMYGTQDAAANWEAAYRETLVKGGFKQGVASSCHYLHADGTTPLMVHGDDFIATGTRAELARLKAVLEAEYEVKAQMCGPWSDTPQSMRVLGRVISFTSEGIGYEADPRHIEAALAAYNLQDCKPVSTPWAAETRNDHVDLNLRRRMAETQRAEEVLWKEDEQSENFEYERLKTYQSVAARLNYLCLDRTDVQFAVKEVMRKMSNATEADEQKLKRLIRYLKGSPRVIQTYPFEELPDNLTIYVDSNFAGCSRTRKSTSGGVVCWGSGVVKSWSKTQATIALSSGEAELAAVIKGAAEGLGLKAVLSDFGVNVGLEMYSDATAAIGMVRREGLGRVRHLAVADLWIQQKVRSGDISVAKIPGVDNPSDMCTKGLDQASIQRHMSNLGLVFSTGRHALAPQLH